MMHSLKTYLWALTLVTGGILAGCGTPQPTTVVVPGDTPTPQTTERTITHTETKQSTPPTVNPDGSTNPASETTQKTTTVEKKQQ